MAPGCVEARRNKVPATPNRTVAPLLISGPPMRGAGVGGTILIILLPAASSRHDISPLQRTSANFRPPLPRLHRTRTKIVIERVRPRFCFFFFLVAVWCQAVHNARDAGTQAQSNERKQRGRNSSNSNSSSSRSSSRRRKKTGCGSTGRGRGKRSQRGQEAKTSS